MLLKEEHLPVETVADIGCDHAFVSMACVEQGITKHVIAMDVGVQPLEIAMDNIREYGYEEAIETRLSDGFSALQKGEADWAIIAGMGGALMARILKQAASHLARGVNLVLQPQSEAELVRLCLNQMDYGIVDEEMLIEDGKYYTIIKAKKGKATCNAMECKYGPVLLQTKHAILIQFLNEEYAKKRDLQVKLQASDTEAAKNRCEQLEQELHMIKDALHCMQD